MKKIICLQTLEVFESQIDCMREMFNSNRNNMNLKRNLNGETLFYNDFSFEFFDEDQDYKKAITKTQHIAFEKYLTWKDKFFYKDQEGNTFKTLREAGEYHNYSRERIRQLLGVKFFKVTNEDNSKF